MHSDPRDVISKSPMSAMQILIIAITYVLVNTATDLLYRWLDPRINVE